MNCITCEEFKELNLSPEINLPLEEDYIIVKLNSVELFKYSKITGTDLVIVKFLANQIDTTEPVAIPNFLDIDVDNSVLQRLISKEPLPCYIELLGLKYNHYVMSRSSYWELQGGQYFNIGCTLINDIRTPTVAPAWRFYFTAYFQGYNTIGNVAYIKTLGVPNDYITGCAVGGEYIEATVISIATVKLNSLVGTEIVIPITFTRKTGVTTVPPTLSVLLRFIVKSSSNSSYLWYLYPTGVSYDNGTTWHKPNNYVYDTPPIY